MAFVLVLLLVAHGVELANQPKCEWLPLLDQDRVVCSRGGVLGVPR